MSTRPTVAVEQVRFYEREVPFRLPFRFGVVTLTGAPQVFVRLHLRLGDGRVATGQAAEMLAPKWFDKSPDLSNAQNFDQLRQALALAAAGARALGGGRTAFGLHAAMVPGLHADCAAEGLNGLIAGFGAALIDRAVLDALCRLEGISVFEAVRRNLPGIDAATTPDLSDAGIGAVLASLAPAATIAARHTVGLADALTEAEIEPGSRLHDGLPESLEAAVAAYGLRFFKLKLSGDRAADLDRLSRIAAVLDRTAGDYRISLDGNEQYEDAEAATAFLRAVRAVPALSRLADAVMYVEQPIARSHALAASVAPLAALAPVLIDESDAGIEVFPRARALGYAGISSKACKGVYRSLLNRVRVAAWNAGQGGPRHFMSAEDLTTQPGVAIQQDLALATLIGCTDVERNGHHYVDGMAGAPLAEQARFRAAHPDLYHGTADGRTRVTIRNGRLAIGSLAVPGLGGEVEPEWNEMEETEYGGA